MAAVRVVGKNARMYVNDVALYLRMFEMENNMELNTKDGTAYGVDWREFTFIDGSVTMGVNAFMDETRPVTDANDLVTDAAYVNTFQADGGSVFKADPEVPIIFVPGNSAAAGEKAFFMNSILGSVALSAPRNDIQTLRGRFQGADGLRAGFIIAQIEQSFPTGDTFLPAPTGDIDVGAPVAAVTGVVAAYCVYKKTAGSVFTIEVQDTATSGSAWAAAIAFPTFTAISAAYKEDITDAGKRYHRIRVNNAGGAETLGLIVVSANLIR
ncbi:hypothetical protein LCGC14_0448660 [marine sediment metagenome]|uniref:Uncharacterized protein n=1 Tax=marine sediment metagenome TaxID=412755 RepID=A0A0F9SI99_9ZZZZ